MKLFSIIKKNFKLLIRAKASAFTVLIGPLLVILLVGLAFSGKASYELSLGYYASQHTNLTNNFVDSLKQSHYYVQEFNNEQDCVKKVEQGIIHTCIIFPENFQVSNEKSSELRFLVDYSRMNLVYKVIESVSGILDLKSEEVSYSLTQALLSRINSTVKDLSKESVLVANLNPQFNLLVLDLQKAKANTESMKLELQEVDLNALNSSVITLNDTIMMIIEKGGLMINSTDEWIDDLGVYENVSNIREEFAALRDELLNLYNLTPNQIKELIDDLNVLSNSLTQLESDLAANRQLNTENQKLIDSAKTRVASIQTNIVGLKTNLEKTRQELESIDITNVETIVSPVNTKIEPVVSETSKLTFTFPFLLVLVIMFVALLLSSTLVMFEKSSKSFFRNHITPIRQEFFVFTTFITSFIVIVMQTLIILGLANYFMQIPLFKNALCTAILVILTSAFFIVLGMAVGYLFSTQEGAIMASIVLGSIFLFLSNLVVPLESLAPALTNIIKYNPYVLASELLRKSLLFNVNIMTEALLTLITLGGAALIMFLLIIFGVSLRNKKKVKASKQQDEAINQDSEISASAKREPGNAKAGVAGFVVGEKKASNKQELLKLVSDMTRSEFEDNVTQYENKIADWVEKELKEKKLASKLRKSANRKDTVKVLSEDIEMEEKKQPSQEE
ncbi:ABC transporter permease [Candidatus Woesearchaeota archaeon]|nr:ABC transporter permease [Candidatus Woesearchaeota archaeon]